NIDLARKVKHGISADLYAVANEFAEQFSAASRQLPSEQFCLAKLFRPVRDQIAVRRTGYWVLKHTHLRSKKSRNKIAVRPRCGHDHGMGRDFQNSRKIRTDLANVILALIDEQVVAGLQYFLRLFSYRFDQSSWRRIDRNSRSRGEIKHKTVTVLFNSQQTAFRLKPQYPFICSQDIEN